MHDMRTIAIDDPVAWASVSQSVTRANVLRPTRSPDGATVLPPITTLSVLWPPAVHFPTQKASGGSNSADAYCARTTPPGEC